MTALIVIHTVSLLIDAAPCSHLVNCGDKMSHWYDTYNEKCRWRWLWVGPVRTDTYRTTSVWVLVVPM